VIKIGYGTYENKKSALDSTELPVNFLSTPELILAQYGTKDNPMDPVSFSGFSTNGMNISPAEFKFTTLKVLVPTYILKAKGKKLITQDISIEILNNPGNLDKNVKFMANRTSTDEIGYSKRIVKVEKASDVRGDYLKKQVFLHEFLEDQVMERKWNFVEDFEIDPHNRRWLITYHPEKIDTILPLFKSYMDIERIGHSTPKGLIESPLGMAGSSGRPGPIYQAPGYRGIYQLVTDDYLIKTKNQLIASQGAIFAYLQLSDKYNEHGIIKCSLLIDTMLRNGLYGTETLRDAIQLLPLFSRCGIGPAIYHLAYGKGEPLSKEKRIQALELFTLRLWMFLHYVAMMKSEGIDNLETVISYVFQGRTPPTQEILDKSFSYGLHPLEDGYQVKGVCNYYYPPTSSAHLKHGYHKLISTDAKFKNVLSVQSKLRPSKVRSAVVEENDVYNLFPNLVEEQVDYAIIAPINEAQEMLRRELYGSPQEYDELTIVGRITTTNGFSSTSAAVSIIDTLLFGGSPLHSWDQLYRPIRHRFTTKSIHRNDITKSYDAEDTEWVKKAGQTERDYYNTSVERYSGLTKVLKMYDELDDESKAQFLIDSDMASVGRNLRSSSSSTGLTILQAMQAEIDRLVNPIPKEQMDEALTKREAEKLLRKQKREEEKLKKEMMKDAK
jgi:hypothetical protein